MQKGDGARLQVDAREQVLQLPPKAPPARPPILAGVEPDQLEHSQHLPAVDHLPGPPHPHPHPHLAQDLQPVGKKSGRSSRYAWNALEASKTHLVAEQ